MRSTPVLVSSVILTGILSLAAFGSYAASEKIKLYTAYGSPHAHPIDADVDISMIINNELVIAKNTSDMNSGASYGILDSGVSYVEVDSKYNFQEISEAKSTWLKGGKKYLCTADNLPLYVQGGDVNTATKIYFNCVN